MQPWWCLEDTVVLPTSLLRSGPLACSQSHRMATTIKQAGIGQSVDY